MHRNRGNFCLSMASAFRSSVGPQDLKIFNFNYYERNKQQKWHNKIAILEKKFWKWNTLGCFISIKSEKITFGRIWKFLGNFLFTFKIFKQKLLKYWQIWCVETLGNFKGFALIWSEIAQIFSKFLK